MPSRPLTPERAASVRVYSLAKNAAWAPPTAAERDQVVAELRDTAAEFPHLLAENAGLFLGAARNTSVEESVYLAAAQLLIDAGADLADVDRWTQIGDRRTRPPGPA